MSRLYEKWDILSRRSKVLVGGGLVAALIIIPIFITVYFKVLTGTITLTYAPKSAQVKIGGKSASFGDNTVTPGTHEVTITKAGFATYKQTVTVTGGQKVVVEAGLESNDPSTANWYQTHPEDYTIYQGIGDRKADAAYAKQSKDFPIAKILPIVGLYDTYRVDYGVAEDDKTKNVIYISYKNDTYKAQAIKAVEQAGYKLSDYTVVYKRDAPDVENGVTITGADQLLARGLSSNAADLIKEKLTNTYRTYKGESITIIAIENDVNHFISDDGNAGIYTATLMFNTTKKMTLRITITGSKMSVVVTAVDGSDATTIYDGTYY